MNDKWIPQPLTCRIQSLPTMLPCLAKVEQLIDTNIRRWNSTLVNSPFYNMEAKAVLHISIGLLHSFDKLICQYTTLGSFSIKSTYHMYKEITDSGIGKSSFQLDRMWL